MVSWRCMVSKKLRVYRQPADHEIPEGYLAVWGITAGGKAFALSGGNDHAGTYYNGLTQDTQSLKQNGEELIERVIINLDDLFDVLQEGLQDWGTLEYYELDPF